MTTPLRAVIVEDRHVDAELMVREIERAGFDLQWTRVDSRETFAASIETLPDIVLADYNLPGWKSTDALRMLRAVDTETAFILVSGTIGEDAAVEAMRLGATDYVLKNQIARLGPAVAHALETRRLRVEQRALQLQLERSEAHFRALIEHSSDLIVVFDAQGVIRYNSPESFRRLGYEEHEVIGRPATEFVHPDDHDSLRRHLRECVASPGVPVPDASRVRAKDGTYRQFEGVLTNMLGNPAVNGIVINFQDVTERAHLRTQLAQAQKMEVVGRLAGGIAHDFNNILTVINGTAELALGELGDTDPLCAQLREIGQAGQRAAALTRQLLAFSRKQVLKPQAIDLRSVVAGMSSMIRRLIGEDISLVLPAPGVPIRPVLADTGQIEQLILNLAINARDAMPDGGTLTIDARQVEAGEPCPPINASAPNEPFIVLSVQDTGCGMDETVRSHLFEPFFTTKGPGRGTGLGLATVHGIVAESGGQISVDTAPGRGSTFKIYLPCTTEMTDASAPLNSTPVARPGETILIVEDEPGVRQLAEAMLTSLGYAIVTAASGGEALQWLRGYDGPLHLLLTDVVLPGLNGPEIARQVTSHRPAARVLYMSGYTEDALLRRALIDRAIHYLAKPFTRVGLARTVRHALDSSASGPSQPD